MTSIVLSQRASARLFENADQTLLNDLRVLQLRLSAFPQSYPAGSSGFRAVTLPSLRFKVWYEYDETEDRVEIVEITPAWQVAPLL